MKREAAAEVFSIGDLVDISMHSKHNGIISERSSGRIKMIETGGGEVPYYGGKIPYISFSLEDLTAGDKSHYLIQWPERISYENEVLHLRDEHYYYTIKPKGKLVIPS